MITQPLSHVLTAQSDSGVCVRAENAWRAAYVSRKHPFKDRPNEDALGWFVVDDETAVFLVADGCGGMRGGELAAQLALQHVVASIAQYRDRPDRMRFAILDGIDDANEAIRSLRLGAACTLAAVELHRGRIRTYHVGDAKVLIMSNRGKLHHETICHSPVGFAVESGWLPEEDAMHHEERHLVSNVVGCESMRIEVGPSMELGARDTILLATDGLFDNLSNAEIIDAMRKGELEASLKGVAQQAHHRMQDGESFTPCKPDDLSMIAVRLAQSQAHDRDHESLENALR